MKLRDITLIAVIIFTVIHQSMAQTAQFFRISGPTSTTIIDCLADGTIVWSNALAGTTYTVQTAVSSLGGTNWTGYAQFQAVSNVNTNQLNAPNYIDNMTLVRPGIFVMGDNLDDEIDAIPTNVNVSAFYIDWTLVTYGQWQTVFNWATNNGYSFAKTGFGKAVNHPAQTVDWYDVVKWCNARSQLAGLTPVYYTDLQLKQMFTNGDSYTDVYANWTASGYRLPTEAEWEKAARGGVSGQRFPWSGIYDGNGINEDFANYIGGTVYSYDDGPSGFNSAFDFSGFPYTNPVYYFQENANNYNLCDMAGNVFEWCWDWYGTPYAGGTDPHGPMNGSNRVARGGAWSFSAYYCRCAYRGNYSPTFSANWIGFRCVRGLFK